MATTEIEIRVSALESEIATLKEKLAKIEKPPTVWWQKISGTFADDADYEEAMRLGREYRLEQKDEKLLFSIQTAIAYFKYSFK